MGANRVTDERARVEAVIVSYKSASALGPCLTSLVPWLADLGGVVLVDNCPGDGSSDVARRIVPGLRLIESAGNVGFAAAVNSAIRTSSADVFILVNPDCRVVDGTLAALLSLFEEDSRVGAVGVRMVGRDGLVARNCKRTPGPYDFMLYDISANTRFPGWSHPSRMRLAQMDYAVAQPVESLSGAFLALHRRALDDIGLLDERYFLYCEETDWCARATRAGWRCLYTPAVSVEHDGGGSVATWTDLGPVMLESELKYVRKHYGIAPAAVNYVGMLGFDLLRLARSALPGERRRERLAAVLARLPVYAGRTQRPRS
jgi:GT2 family glycosyltransferase